MLTVTTTDGGSQGGTLLTTTLGIDVWRKEGSSGCRTNQATRMSRITTNFRAGEMRNGCRGGMERVGRTNDVEKTVTTLVVRQRKELEVIVRNDDTEEKKITRTGRGLRAS